MGMGLAPERGRRGRGFALVWCRPGMGPGLSPELHRAEMGMGVRPRTVPAGRG